MSNNKPPKELYVGNEFTEIINGNMRTREFASTERVYDEQIKYISESHYNKVVERKNFLIASQKQVITDLEAEVERLNEKNQVLISNLKQFIDEDF